MGAAITLQRASWASFQRLSISRRRPGILVAHASTVAALVRALETGGIEFIDENGGGPGVRLRKTTKKRT